MSRGLRSLVVVFTIFFISAAFAQETPTNVLGNLDSATGEVLVSWDPPDDALSYNVYRDDVELGNAMNTWYVDGLTEGGTFEYTVTAVYDGDIESDPSDPVESTWDGVLGIPGETGDDILFSFDEDTGEVVFIWNHPVGDEELIYDTEESLDGYAWPTSTMSSQMSPAGPCRILRLEYDTFYTEHDAENPIFDAKIFLWDEGAGEPETEPIYEEETVAVNGAWMMLDVSDENIIVDGDFVVGFGSVLDSTYVIFEEVDNGRSWDLFGGAWDSWHEAYHIRAVVQYLDSDDAPVVLSNFEQHDNELDELDSFTGYHVYLNDVEVTEDPLNINHFIHVLDDLGTYTYTVTAEYASGESDPSLGLVIEWGIPIIIPENLTAELDSVSGQVTLNWIHPDADTTDIVQPTPNKRRRVIESGEVGTDGRSYATLSNEIVDETDELDEFLHFNVLRDLAVIADDVTHDVYIDQLPAPGTYIYHVQAVYDEGTSENSNVAPVNWQGDDVNETSLNGIPSNFEISEVYPNPFNPNVNIVLALPESGIVNATVYDVLGRQVAVLNNSTMNPGYHTLTWFADGNPAGIYFLKASVLNGAEEIRKLMYLK